MAMSNCKECGKAVSTLAKTCPSCGVPKPAKVLKKKTSTKKITTKIKKDKTYVWAHCKSNSCKGFDRMLKIPSSALGKRFCSTCGRYVQKAKDTQTRAYNKPIEKIDSIYAYAAQGEKDARRTQTTSGEKDVFQKFAEGELDLATAFWGFGVVGSILVGVVTGFLSEAVSKNFVWGYVIVTGWIVISLWQCAETYKKEMTEQKQSIVWGILTQAYCVLGVFGLFNFIKDV